MLALGSTRGALRKVQAGATPHLYGADRHPHDPIISESFKFCDDGDSRMLRQEGVLDQTRSIMSGCNQLLRR